MAATNLTEVIGDFDRHAPIAISSRSDSAVPFFEDPVYIVMFVIIVLSLLVILGFLCLVLHQKVQAYNKTWRFCLMRAEREQYAAAVPIGLIHPNGSVTGHIVIDGSSFYYNYLTKRFDETEEPGKYHFDHYVELPLEKAASRVMELKRQKWLARKLSFLGVKVTEPDGVEMGRVGPQVPGWRRERDWDISL